VTIVVIHRLILFIWYSLSFICEDIYSD